MNGRFTTVKNYGEYLLLPGMPRQESNCSGEYRVAMGHES